MQFLLRSFQLVITDLVFLLALFLGVMLLSMVKRAAFAVLKRNFLAYFANPTGYVFLCLFVLLTSMAAFWPNEFFNSNLANLDQLNFWFPFIMLFFIPAITMSIWAEEKRQGTDELLLTLPADDFDIVIGKYLSAAAIYTVSLLFSQVSTYIVLMFLSSADLDSGLFLANYLGYWFIGLAMLALGMVASFLTSNLTVGFILGAIFNTPLAFASVSSVIVSDRKWANLVSMFSIREQFDNFGRGVVSLAPVAFFILMICFGLYLSMVLIGRRHWSGGKDGNSMFLHYLTRVPLFLVIAFCLSYFLKNNDRLRFDATEGQVSSLSPRTKQVIRSLKPERPIVIDAFISKDMPEQYAETRYDLVTLLKEFQALASSRKIKLQVNISDDLDPTSEEAERARKSYGIEPQTVLVREEGTYQNREVLLGAAVQSGLSKVIIPFFETGIPVEYELVRSINTVSQPKRMKLGIVRTDANLMGGFSMAGGMPRQMPKNPLVEELERQYDVEEVNPATAISSEQYDVLLAIQPSSLGPAELKNLIAAVKAGVPTAIFEDPMPIAFGAGVPGTGEPKQAAGGGGMFGMQQQPPQPKGDITELWAALGIRVPTNRGGQGPSMGIHPDIVWQKYNPQRKIENLNTATDQWLFVLDAPTSEDDYLSEDSPVTEGLRELMLLYAGKVEIDSEREEDFKITPLVKTREFSGLITYDDIQNQPADMSTVQMDLLQGDPLGEQYLAVLIEGTEADAGEAAGESEGEASADAAKPIKAIYVTDIDLVAPVFGNTRKRPEQFEEDFDLRVQNITFALNVVDVLAGELDYPVIRRHQPMHVTLKLFEEQAAALNQVENEKRKEYQQEFDQAIKEAETEIQEAVVKYQDRAARLRRDQTDPKKAMELLALEQEMMTMQSALQRKLLIKRSQLEAKRDSLIADSRREAGLKVKQLQAYYKYMAILLPPILPMLVGIGVFVTRRVREREGISKARLR